MYYILKGKKAIPWNSILVWAKWFEKADRTVKKTKLNKDVEVSTIFLGIDHAFSIGSSCPLLFETKVFGGDEDEKCERYSTWDEAEKGHKQIVSSLLSLNEQINLTEFAGQIL